MRRNGPILRSSCIRWWGMIEETTMIFCSDRDYSHIGEINSFRDSFRKTIPQRTTRGKAKMMENKIIERIMIKVKKIPKIKIKTVLFKEHLKILIIYPFSVNKGNGVSKEVFRLGL